MWLIDRSKTLRSTRSCLGPKRSKTRSKERPKQLVWPTACRTSKRSTAKSNWTNNWKQRPNPSTCGKKNRWTRLSSEWSRRIERWPVFNHLSSSRLRQTWFCRSMRSVLWLSVKRKWMHSRMKWYASTLSSSSNAWIRSRQLRMLLRRLVTQSLGNLKRRRCRDVPKKSFRRICAMSFTLKRGSWPQEHESKQRSWSENGLSSSYKKLRSSRWDSKRRGLPRKSDLRRISNKNFWRSLLRMSVLSRWMLRRGECASWSTDVKSSDFGKLSWRSLGLSVKLRCRSILRC